MTDWLRWCLCATTITWTLTMIGYSCVAREKGENIRSVGYMFTSIIFAMSAAGFLYSIIHPQGN